MAVAKRVLGGVASAAVTTMLVSGCTKHAAPQPLPPPPNPTLIAGKPVSEGPSGLRPNPPGPLRSIENGDGGDIDRVAALSVADIEQFWADAYGKPLEGKFTPVDALFSYDSRYKHGKFCGSPTAGDANLYFCGIDAQNCPSAEAAPCSSSYNTIGWDRGVFVPQDREWFGDLGVALDLAHEYGHALTHMAGLLPGDTPADQLGWEQQADCFAGVYLRWVADGHSPRFTMSTGEGLSKMLASQISARDSLLLRGDPRGGENLVHGTAFERVVAFQIGFDNGMSACAAIDPTEIEERRKNLPKEFLEQGTTGEAPINQDLTEAVIDATAELFDPAQSPTVSFDAPSCPDAKATPPASYCPSTNTITVDMNPLVLMGSSLSRGSPIDIKPPMLFGDYTAYSVLVSRYMLAIQKGRGLMLDNTNAGLRTACLTGVATAKLANGVTLPGGGTIKLYGGDLDEAVAGILTNGLVAANVNGEYAPSAFARIDAFRTGVLRDQDTCYQRWA